MEIDIVWLAKKGVDIERTLAAVRKVLAGLHVNTVDADEVAVAGYLRDVEMIALEPQGGASRSREDILRSIHEGYDPACPLYLNAHSLQRALYPLSKGRDVVVVHPFLMLTWNRWEGRYHARTVMFGYPSLVSLPGIVEAPARPRAYHLMRMSGEHTTQELDEMFEGTFITHDSDLTQYAAVCILQCCFHLFFGKGLCISPACILYDSHRQSEMMERPARDLCPLHRRIAAGQGGSE